MPTDETKLRPPESGDYWVRGGETVPEEIRRELLRRPAVVIILDEALNPTVKISAAAQSSPEVATAVMEILDIAMEHTMARLKFCAIPIETDTKPN